MIMLLALGIIALSTSSIAGLFGFGGGMLLIMGLSFFVPPQALIPLHSTVQLSSNSSRAIMDWRAVHLPFIREHFIGSVVGVALAFWLFKQLNLSWLPLIIACYILLHTWSKHFSALLARFESLYVLGALQTGIALIAGAPGPIPLPYLMKKLSDHHQIVVTMAVFMTVGHVLKLLIFIASGFNFLGYWKEILVMCLAAIVGSFLGTKLRYQLAADRFTWIAKALLTLLSLAAIARVLIENGILT